MFDLARLDTRTKSETGVGMPVLHPGTKAPILDDTGEPLTITLLGRTAEGFRSLQREADQRWADMEARGIPMTNADYERERFDILCGITRGWAFDTLDGQPFPFTEDNVRRFWADKRWSWLQVQAWAFANEDGNYLGA